MKRGSWVCGVKLPEDQADTENTLRREQEPEHQDDDWSKYQRI